MFSHKKSPTSVSENTNKNKEAVLGPLSPFPPPPPPRSPVRSLGVGRESSPLYPPGRPSGKEP